LWYPFGGMVIQEGNKGKEGKRERGKEGKRERGKEGKRERGKEGKKGQERVEGRVRRDEEGGREM
jgi:hypothetical protein